MILSTLFISSKANAEYFATNCEAKLAACDNYVEALQTQVGALENLNVELKKQRDDAFKRAADIQAEQGPIDKWGWLFIGALAGGVVHALIR